MNEKNIETTQSSATPTADDLIVLSVLLQSIKGISSVSTTSSTFDMVDDIAQ